MRRWEQRPRCFAGLWGALALAIAVPAGLLPLSARATSRTERVPLVAGSMRPSPGVVGEVSAPSPRRAVDPGLQQASASAPRIVSPASGFARSLPAGGGIVALEVETRHATTCSLRVVAAEGLTVTPMHRSGCGRRDLVVGPNPHRVPATVVLEISARRGAVVTVRDVLVRVRAAVPSPGQVASFRGTFSDNWSGYLAPSTTTVTDTAGDFAIPSVDCASAPSGAGVSFWVGTGGSGGGQPLLQTGITESCVAARPRLRAWWEEIPARPEQAHFFTSFPLRVGDRLHAEVFRGANGRWETLLVDQRSGRRAVMVTGEGWGVAASSTAPVLLQHRRVPAHFSGARSAEWITEDYADAADHSLVPLLDFGAVAFSHVRAGPAIQLASDDAVAIEQSGSVRARPSTLAGDRFLVRELGSSSPPHG